MTTEALLTAFGATPEDLERNREGMLGPRQREAAHAATAEDARSMVTLAVVLAAVLYTLLYFLIDGGKLFDLDDGLGLGEIAIGLFAGGLPTAALVYAGNTVRVHLRGRHDARVSCVEGPARLSRERWRQMVLHRVEIDGESFGLTDEAWSALRDGRSYRLYYLPVSRVVVAAESVHDVAPDRVEAHRARLEIS